MIDGVAQARLVLHLYNALLSIGVLGQPIEIIEIFIEAFSSAEANPIWSHRLALRAHRRTQRLRYLPCVCICMYTQDVYLVSREPRS